MSEISRAIQAKQAKINELQADIDALQRAAGIIGGKKKSPAKKRKRRPMSAAARKAVAKRMKAYWAKKRKATK